MARQLGIPQSRICEFRRLGTFDGGDTRPGKSAFAVNGLEGIEGAMRRFDTRRGGRPFQDDGDCAVHAFS
jgi:hypothetical protein